MLSRHLARGLTIIGSMFVLSLFIGSAPASAASRYSVANGNWNSTATWSATSGGAPGASVPVAGDTVTIEGARTVTLTANAACASITFVASATGNTLNLGTFQLDVSGAITIPRSAAVPANLIAVGAGTLNAGSITFTSAGTSVRHQLTISTGTVTVTGNITGSAGNTSPTITFTGAGTLNVGGALFAPADGTLTTFTGSTVNYNAAGAQTVQIFNYSNLTLSGSGAKTGAVTTVNGNLTLGGTATYATGAALAVGGNVNVGDGTTLTVAGFNFTVTGATNIGGGASGNLTFSSTAGTKTFTGLVTINSGATWNDSVNEAINFRGGVTNGGTFTAGTGAYTFTNNAQAINGTISIPTVTVTTITLTNNGSLTVGTALTGTGGLTNSATGVLNIGGTSTITTLTATAVGNVIDYTGASQTVKSTTYDILSFSGSGTKTLGGVVTAGNITIGAGTTLDVSGSNYALNVNGDWVNNNVFTPRSGTVTFGKSGAQSIGGTTAPAFYNLTLTGSGTKTFSAAAAIGGDLAITGTADVDLGSYTSSANTLSLGAAGQLPGSWGGTASAATYQNSTYFGTTATGILNVVTMASLATDYFRSAGTGTWDAISTWESSSDGSTNWHAATLAPSNTANTITIQNSHVVTISAAATLSIDQVVVEAGGEIDLANSAGTLTIANGAGTDLDVYGTFKNLKTTAITLTGTAVFENGSIYDHAMAAGTIPSATWVDGSTVKITGVTGSAPTATLSSIGQNFYNLTWNSPGQSWNPTTGAASALTIRGTFTFEDSGTGSYVWPSADCTVANYVQTGGIDRLSYTAARTHTVGNFSVSGGTADFTQSTGAPVVNISGDVSITGSGALIISGGGGSATVNFAGTSLQTFSSGGTISGAIGWNINSGAIVDFGTSVLSGGASSNFSVASGGSIITANTAGLTASGAAGSIQVGGTRTYSTGANYEYNGSANQVTGDGLPATVNNLVIDNSGAGGDNTVTLTQVIAVTGDLSVTNGMLGLGVSTAHTANALYLGGTHQANGTWGSSASVATHQNDTYFSGSGYVTIATGLTDSEEVANAKAALLAASPMTATEGVDTDAVTMAQAIVDAAASGVTVSMNSSANGHVDGTTGAITYDASAETANVTFDLDKGVANDNQVVSFIVPAHILTDSEEVANAKAALLAASPMTATEGVDTDAVTMAQAIVDAAASGVTVSMNSSANGHVDGTTGAITYDASAETANVTFDLDKGVANDNQVVSFIVPAHILTDSEEVANAKAALLAASPMTATEGVDTDAVTMAQAIVDAAASGVTVSMNSSANGHVDGTTGAITYDASAETANVTFDLDKGVANDNQVVSFIVPAHILTDSEEVANAKAALLAASPMTATEGVDTDAVTMAQAIVDAAASGVTVSMNSSANGHVDGTTGAITYDASAETANVTFDLDKGVANDNQVVSFIVPAHILITPTLSITNSPVTYNGSSQAATVVGSVAGVVSDRKYDGSSTVPINVGTYAVTADFVPDDTINYSSLNDASAGNLTINAKSITVTAVAKSKVVGASDPTLTYTSSDGSATFTGSLVRAAGEAVGTYTISQGTLAVVGTNFTISSFISANFTITDSGGGSFSLPSAIGDGSADFSIPMGATENIGNVGGGGINLLGYINSLANFTALVSHNRLLEQHGLSIIGLDLFSNIITIRIDSNSQEFSLNLGDTVKVDLDGDNTQDVSVKFEDVFINRAELTIKSLLDSGQDCPTLSAGDMVKVIGKPAIYALNNALQVLYFPSGDEFKSWRPTYGGYISISQSCFDTLSVPSAYPGAVNYRPGSYIVKRPSLDQLYVVEPDNTLATISPSAAAGLYGANYTVMTVADVFWPHYINRGTDISTATPHPGMLIKVDGVTYYVEAGNTLREVTSAGMTANGFQTKFVYTLSNSVVNGWAKGNKLETSEPVLTNKTQ